MHSVCWSAFITAKLLNNSIKINIDASIKQNTAIINKGKCYKISMENIVPTTLHKNVCTI